MIESDTSMTDNTMTDKTMTDTTITHTNVKSTTDEPLIDNPLNDESDNDESDAKNQAIRSIEENKIEVDILNIYLLPDLTNIILEYTRIQPEITYNVPTEIVIQYTDYKYVSGEFTVANYTDSKFYKDITNVYGADYANYLLYDKRPYMRNIIVKIRDIGFGAYDAIVLYGKNPNASYRVYVTECTIWHKIESHCLTLISLKDKARPDPVRWYGNVNNLLRHTTDAHYDLTTYSGLIGYIQHYRRMQKLIRPTHITTLTFS